MVVCDICGKNLDVKTYTLPARGAWHCMHEGEIVCSYLKYEDKQMDLCSSCSRTIADYIDHVKAVYKEKEL